MSNSPSLSYLALIIVGNLGLPHGCLALITDTATGIDSAMTALLMRRFYFLDRKGVDVLTYLLYSASLKLQLRLA